MNDVLTHTEILLPDEDEYSGDEFGGYLSSGDEDGRAVVRRTRMGWMVTRGQRWSLEW